MHSQYQHLIVDDHQRALRREADMARLAAIAAHRSGSPARRPMPPTRPLAAAHALLARIAAAVAARIARPVPPSGIDPHLP